MAFNEHQLIASNGKAVGPRRKFRPTPRPSALSKEKEPPVPIFRRGRQRFKPGDCVRLVAPVESFTVVCADHVSVEVAFLDADGKLQTLFFAPEYLQCLKPSGRRPQKGDKVRLPSGGPVMTLYRMSSATRASGECCCEWLEGKKLRRLWCDVELLEVIEDA